MFNTRADVDRHVQNCMKKINNESERNSRCLAFAKLYLKVGEYEQARRYISTYLSSKPHSEEGQYVLGQALEKLGKKDAALEAYRSSLEINPKQNNLLIKICEILSSDEINFDQSYARYYCEKAQSIDPHNQIVFNLKAKLISSATKDPKEISQLYLREIETRPKDLPSLGVRLLRHLLENNLISEAFEHILSFDRKNLNDAFSNNINWYETVANVLVRYQRENISQNLTWEYWMLSISTLNNLVMLSLDERAINVKSTADCISAVFNFDQSLKVAAENIKNCPHKQLTQEFLKHYRGQLCFHLATLIFKLAKVNSIKYKEASEMSLPLLFSAYHISPPEIHCMWLDHATPYVKTQIQRWHREACYRCSQTGHIIVAAAKDQQKLLIEKANLESTGYWQEKLFKKIFVSREQQSKMTSSFFATSSDIAALTLRIPDLSEIAVCDEYAQMLYPDSLHHYIWIGMNQNLVQFKLSLFNGFLYSTRNLTNCSAESLNVLDVQSFLYAAILCAQSQIEDSKHSMYLNPNKPNILPAAVTDTLGTLNQSKWLQAAWKKYKEDYRSDFGEMRLTLIKGIEAVRCIGNHGMDVKLLVSLARIYTERSQNLTKQSEIEFNSARAETYWKAALPILEKLKNNQVVSYAPNKLFDFKSKEMSLNEILTHIESGKLFNSIQLMKKKEYEKALQIFETLKDPYASFYQAQIYKTLAEEQTSFNKENVTSEMRSQRITLLSHVRDYLYLTLDRLRDPTVDKKHPLNSQLATEIERIDRIFSRIDPDVNNRNECDGMSDENSSYSSLPDHNFQNISFTNGVSPKPDALLRVESSFRREARPSPERLDAQIRQLLASKDIAMHNILEQHKIMVDSHKILVDELRSFKEVVSNLSQSVNELKGVKQTVEELRGIKSSVDELKASVDDLQSFRNVTDLVYEMKKELTELKKDTNKLKNNPLNDDDLYVIDEEYQDYGINPNVPNLNCSNIPNRLPPAPGLYGAHPLYQGLAMGYPMLPYGPMGYPQPPAGGLAFHPDQQLSELLSMNALFPQAINQSGLCQGLPPVAVNPKYPHANLNNSGMAQTLLPSNQPNVFNKDAGNTPNLYLNQSQTLLSTASITSPIQSASVIQQSTTKAPPVNVVITSSDPLPTTKITTAPILSVSIPPQHLKGNISKTQPHNYQIPLPPRSVGTTVTAPSVMNQTPLPVTTKNLLANVSPPIYSSIVDKNSPEKNAGLGFHIEKTLSQSFNASYSDVNKSAQSISSTTSEEEDPRPDFKPIVPLPAEVPLNTGEEKEEVLFCERAKLFRFVGKEWRERGVGQIKILHNKETNKIRILMRRDQVHKICANHFITEDMILTPMSSSDRAFIWAAQDFADENIVMEKLSAKFKTPTEAQKFYNVFETAKKMLATNEVVTTKQNIVTATTPEKSQIVTTSLGGFVFTSTPTFQPKQLESKPEVSVEPEPLKSSPFASFSFVKQQTGNNVSTSNALTPTSLFGEMKTAANTSEPVTQSCIKQLENVKSDYILKTPVINLSKLDGSGDTDETRIEDFIPTAEFKPVVPLPDLIEIKTGEENAEVLFEHKAKLLRFDTDNKEWKERGVGIMKILKQNDLVRFVMRREQVHKVCCNHQLLKGMSFQKMTKNPKAVTWYAEDFSEGEFKSEMFAIRFKSEDITNKFLDVVIKNQETLNDSCVGKTDECSSKKSDKKSKPDNSKDVTTPPSSKGFGDKFKPKSGSWECKNCYIVNESKINYCVACETPKNDTVPKKTPESGPQFSFGVKSNIQFTNNASDTTPQSHFVFGHKLGTTPTCSSSVTFHFGAASSPAVTVTTQASTTPTTGFGDAFKSKPGTWECSCCYIRNDDDKDYCLSCDNPKNSTIPKKEEKLKGVNLDTPGLTFKFGIQPANTTTEIPKACDNNAVKSEMSFKFGSTGGFSFNAAADSTTNDEKSLNLTSNTPFNFNIIENDKNVNETSKSDTVEKFVFGSPQQHNFEFTPRSPRRQSGGHGDDESDGSYVEEEADNIYFKPVIPMPDKVDVLTGEENEEVLYCHRAKLFRFKDAEWKERGVGDIKILYKKDIRKLRVLMRREKILKICLNHVLTKDIEYRPKDDKTWLFAAPDFSEGEIEHDQFCLRFKTAEIAANFKGAIDEALKKISDDCEESDTDSDVEIVSETTVTAEEEQEAIKLGLPPKFFSYRQLPNCKCDQCKKEDEMFKGLLDTPKLETEKSKKTTFTFTLPKTDDENTPKSIFGTPTSNSSSIFGSSQNYSFKTPTGANIFGNIKGNIFGDNPKSVTSSGSIFNTSCNEPVANIFGAKTPETSKVTLENNIKKDTTNLFTKPTISTTNSIFSSPVTTANTFFNSPKNIFSNVPTTNTESVLKKSEDSTAPTSTTITTTSTFGMQPISQRPIFGNTLGSTILDANKTIITSQKGAGDFPKLTTSTNLNEADKIFNCDSTLSFASLVNQDAPTKFQTIKDNEQNPFASLGAGAPVFSSKSTKSSEQKETLNKSQTEEEAVEGGEEYDPHYEPIVPLPEEIKVSTGEEEEETLFNERAKVYRYDGKEWKERGVGQLKVLHHPVKCTYRLLLRREQVHKVVLNQLITEDLNMQPMSTSDKAWLWGGYNYAEDEPVLEKLAARFKNTDLAMKFDNVIKDVLNKIKDQQSKNIPTTVEEISDNEERRTSEGDDDDEEEDYDDDDERSIMIAKTCIFSVELPSGEWHEFGEKDIQIYYDSDFYGSRISVNDDTGLIISNTFIGINTIMTRENKTCAWTAVEWANNLFEWRNFRATFDSAEDAEEFYLSYEEGVGYAQHSDIVDEIPYIPAIES